MGLIDKASGIASGSANEIDQVAGNAEDDIGDNIAFIRESELLYGDDSLLTVYGPLIADICANPKKFKVRPVLMHARRVPDGSADAYTD